LLGVRAVIAESFERIHRSNLIGMGVLPLQFKEGDSWRSLGLKGDETITVHGVDKLTPRSEAKLSIASADGKTRDVAVVVRIDTADELDYYKHGGILQYVVRQLAAA
jgi:aconitate hydratase